MIVDMHTHYGLCYEERDGLDPTRWLAGLDAEGVSGAAVSGHRALYGMADTRPCNEALAQVVAAAPDRLVGFATVHPFAGHVAVEEAQRCLRSPGMKGIKLHPWLQGFPYLGGREVHELCEACGAMGAPLLFHEGTSNVSMPAQVAQLARAHPRTTFILGHAGLMHLWRQAAEAAALRDNVYLVLCGPHPAALRHACRRVPIERILWGTDYGCGFENWIRYRKRLVDLLGLTDREREAVMGENAARLLHWRPRF